MTVEMRQASCKGIIICGGPSVGTRFRPLSMTVPKPLFPVAGDAMISHHVRALSEVPGMREILLIGFFDSNVFDKFILDALQYTNIPIRYLREYQALGTAGCLFHFRDEILRGDTEKIFVMNADICCSFPLKEMIQFHEQKAAMATMMSIPMDRSELHKYGCIAIDKETKRVTHFVEKPETFISDLISCGIYLFNAQEIIKEIGSSMEILRRDALEQGMSDIYAGMSSGLRVFIERDVLARLAGESEPKLYTMTLNTETDFFRQIKTGSSVIPANKLYLEQFEKRRTRSMSNTVNSGPEIVPPVLIHPSARVDPTCRIGPNVCIGPRAVLSRGARVKNSIILDGVEVGPDACVIDAVLGWDSRLGPWSRVEGSPADASHLNATYKGLKIPAAT
ncbi:MAG: hypothetical protein SGCHY_005590, partial [Lobulomycetales sp.]